MSSKVKILTSIIIVSDSSISYWSHVLPIFLRDKKIMSIQLYLPTLNYINLFELLWCTQVTWHTIQHQTYEGSFFFIHSLQCTNPVMLNVSLSFFKYIYQLITSYSTNSFLFLAWLTGHICLRHLLTFASFCWVLCHNSKV